MIIEWSSAIWRMIIEWSSVVWWMIIECIRLAWLLSIWSLLNRFTYLIDRDIWIVLHLFHCLVDRIIDSILLISVQWDEICAEFWTCLTFLFPCSSVLFWFFCIYLSLRNDARFQAEHFEVQWITFYVFWILRKWTSWSLSGFDLIYR